MLRDAKPADAGAIAAIYNVYVAETPVSFEEAPVSDGEMAERIAGIQERYRWIVAEEEGRVLGYAYFGPFRTRAAYRLSAETTVYVDRDERGRGLGTALYAEILESAKAAGFHALLGGIALPNEASVRLHEKFGFRKVAHLEAVGRKFDRWIDVGFWELLL
jgi:L-amino acid N-acyltransferase YncA